MKFLKEVCSNTVMLLGVCLVASLLLSVIRFIGHDHCEWEYKDPKNKELGMQTVCPETPCKPLYVDFAEPLISTRWFCVKF